MSTGAAPNTSCSTTALDGRRTQSEAAVLLRAIGRQLRCDDLEARLCLSRADARPIPSHDLKERLRTEAALLVAQSQRAIRVNDPEQRPQLGARRQHAHDLGGLPVESHDSSDDIRIGAVAGSPERVAQDDDAVATFGILVGTERASERRLNPEHVEE